jgi:hypothetical protein
MEPKLAAALSPATTIGDVLDRMEAIDSALPRCDGVSYFNRLYWGVTEHVVVAMRQSTFEDAQFLERLDVVFANLYFEAVRAADGRREVADAWEPLFALRGRMNSMPIQFALAGMNAHINHDLPLAVVKTCRDLALMPDEGTPHYRDFTAANEVLERTQEAVKASFTAGLIEELDEACGKLDDALAMWSIASARALAWNNAQMLWVLQDNPRALELYLCGLARMVNFGGRGLLI